MRANYQQFAKMLERPVRGRRKVGHECTYIRYVPDSKDIQLYVNFWHGRKPEKDCHLATITPDNVMTLQMGAAAGNIWATNRIRRLTGLWIWSDRRRHSNKEQAVRVWDRTWGDYPSNSIPYFDGMKLNLTGVDKSTPAKVLNMEQAVDKVRRIDREGAAKIRKQLAPLVKLFKVSMKIGAMDDMIASTQRTDKYYKKPTHTLDELVEGASNPDMAQVYALYWHAVKATTLSYWGDIQKEIRDRVPENGARILRQHAYKKNNLYSYVEKE